MKKHVSEREKQVEYQPNFHHLDISSLGQALHNRYEHACKHQHDCKVYSQSRLKEEGFEVVGDVADNVEEDCRRVDSGNGAQQLSSQPNIN